MREEYLGIKERIQHEDEKNCIVRIFIIFPLH
jgi:hypothetical protein